MFLKCVPPFINKILLQASTFFTLNTSYTDVMLNEGGMLSKAKKRKNDSSSSVKCSSLILS